ncbi:MAG: S8 family peptidase [Bacteroidia bacterium]|nr:S8 family peptidase [Bacteroidia bacterium]
MKSALSLSGAFYSISIDTIELACSITTTNDPWTDHINNNWPGFTDDWNWHQVNTYCAWQTTKGDGQTVVTVIDQDLDYDPVTSNSHYDIDMSKATYKLYGTKPSFSGGRESHMTAVVGFLSATEGNNLGIAGIAPNIKLDLREVGNSAFIPRAVDDAIKAGSKIISLSWNGIGMDRKTVERYVKDHGVTFIIAAGNVAKAEYHKQVWDIPGVIIVSSSTKTSPPISIYDGAFHSAHSYYEGVDLLAPGHLLRSIRRNDGSSSMKSNNGTSFAAPTVAGVVALIKSVNNDLTPAQIECIIKSTTQTNIENNSPSDDWYGKIGTGILDAEAAVLEAQAKFGGSILIVTSNTVISSDQDLKVISIFPGATLEFQNCDIGMRDDAIVYIQENAKLVLNNAVMETSDQQCSRGWKGILIDGPSTPSSMYPYSTTLHGKIEANNSTISGAHIAIQLGDPDGDHGPPNTGGLFQLSESTIRNCRYGIKHMGFIDTDPNHETHNPSFAYKTTFTCDDIIPGYFREGVNTHALLNNVNGISFISCTFNNLIPTSELDLSKSAKRGRGIGSWESGFMVSRGDFVSTCMPSSPRSRFEGLEFGIESGYTSSTDVDFDLINTRVLDADFVNNVSDIKTHEDSYTLLWNNTHTWNNNYVMRGTTGPNGNSMTMTGVSACNSIGGKRMDGTYSFNVTNPYVPGNDFCGIYLYAVTDNTFSFSATNAQGTQGMLIDGYNNGNEFQSASTNWPTYAICFDNGTDPGSDNNNTQVACNTFGDELTRGILALSSQTAVDQLNMRAQSVSGSKRYPCKNDYGACNTIPSLNNYRIDGGLSSAFFSSDPNSIEIVEMANNIPTSSCLNNINNIYTPPLSGSPTFFGDNTFCNKSSFMNVQLAYCHGDDQIPMTFDDPEQWWDNETGNPNGGGDPQGPAQPTGDDHWNIEDLLNEIGSDVQQLKMKNQVAKLALIDIQSNSSDQLKVAHAGYLLSHFYDYIEAQRIKIDLVPTAKEISQELTSTSSNPTLNGLTAYPVPFKNNLTLTSSEPISLVRILTLDGREVLEFSFVNETKVDLDVSPISSGMYIVEVESNNLIQKLKILKQ